jgi:hypothetical protein
METTDNMVEEQMMVNIKSLCGIGVMILIGILITLLFNLLIAGRIVYSGLESCNAYFMGKYVNIQSIDAYWVNRPIYQCSIRYGCVYYDGGERCNKDSRWYLAYGE